MTARPWPAEDVRRRDAHIVKVERHTVVWTQQLGPGVRAALKLYRHRGLLGAVRGRLLCARAQREFGALSHLSQCGVPCPEPLFWTLGRSRRDGFWELLATREIRGAVSLYDLAPLGAAATNRVDFGELFRILRRMHHSGLFHGALYATNILVGPEPDKAALYLSDTPRSILFPKSIVGTRMAFYDLLGLCEVLLREFDCVDALAEYGLDPRSAASLLRRWPRYRPHKVWRQRLRGEFLLRRALSGPRKLSKAGLQPIAGRRALRAVVGGRTGPAPTAGAWTVHPPESGEHS